MDAGDDVESLAEYPLGPSTKVRESAKYVASTWTSVTCHPKAIEELAKSLAKEVLTDNMGLDRWKKQELHPQLADKNAIDWIFFVDTLNFSFWSEIEDPKSPEKFAVEYNGKLWTGYWALCAAVNRALDEGIPILSPKYYMRITEEEISHLFRTSTKGVMPMLRERAENLQSAGEVLLRKYEGTFANCVREANYSAQRLIELVLREFPSYRDETVYKGKRVCFYKRAQILAADIWACFEGKDLGRFDDVNEVTIFADYRVPQVLNFFGIVTYSQDLQSKLGSGYVFEYGDEEEVEIRAASVMVVDLLCEEVERILDESRTKISPVNAIVLDHYLWDYRQNHNHEMGNTPYHKVRCIYY